MALYISSMQRLSNLQFLPKILSSTPYLDVQQKTKKLLISLYYKPTPPIAFPTSLDRNSITARARILEINTDTSFSICQTFNLSESVIVKTSTFLIKKINTSYHFTSPLKILPWFSISLRVKTKSLQWLMSCLIQPSVTFLTPSLSKTLMTVCYPYVIGGETEAQRSWVIDLRLKIQWMA